jgi:hypothetical protein
MDCLQMCTVCDTGLCVRLVYKWRSIDEGHGVGTVPEYKEILERIRR